MELKEHFHKGPGQCWSEGRCPTIWTLRWDTDATTSQGKHKPFEKIKQVLLSSTGIETTNTTFSKLSPPPDLWMHDLAMFFWHLMSQENMAHSSYSAAESQGNDEKIKIIY